MALADVTVPDCSFHWDIHHPFIPFRLLSASFYHGSSIFTQWKVAIYPLQRQINYWTFRFLLEIEQNFDGERQITANRVQVGIFLRNRCIDEKDVANVSFKQTSCFAYNFIVNAIANVLQDQELLVVKIALDLPAGAADNHYNFEDSRWLSDDLLQLFYSRFQTNMTLRSSGGDILPVHSCILDARWHNFFNVHAFREGMEVLINISVRALRDILIYLYSGTMNFGWPNDDDKSYITDLFYVKDLYRLSHLDRVLRKRDMQQRRVSEKDVRTITLVFPLGEFVSGQIVGCRRDWKVNRNSKYECIFRIYVQTYSYCGPWLSYSLKSDSGSKFYAQVNLDIRKGIVETSGTVEHTCYQITHVHQCDYTINPNSFVQSENVLFLGCQETFRNFNLVNGPAQIIEGCDSILCTLKFTDGIILDQIQSTVDDLDAEEDEMERLNILGDHLFRLFLNPFEADLLIITPDDGENQIEVYHRIHGAIFAARVPRWRRVFQDVQEYHNMPSVARLFLRSEAMLFILRYIYSGRSYYYVSHDLLDDIEHFAVTGEFPSLRNLIIGIRFEQDIDGSDSE